MKIWHVRAFYHNDISYGQQHCESRLASMMTRINELAVLDPLGRTYKQIYLSIHQR
jgi:hypothetical protein